jgi:hypothetical protein
MKKELRKELQTMPSASPLKKATVKVKKIENVNFEKLETIYLRHKSAWFKKDKKDILSLDNYIIESYIPQTNTIYLNQM